MRALFFTYLVLVVGGLAYTSLQIRGQRTRWASCSTSGAMSFNWRLLLAPSEIRIVNGQHHAGRALAEPDSDEWRADRKERGRAGRRERRRHRLPHLRHADARPRSRRGP